MIVDEAQTGFGRTGNLWAIDKYKIVPDVLLLAKAIGGGLPLGAFVANKSLMDLLSANPVLGHISTFGGHPLSCTSGLAAFNFLTQSNLLKEVESKGQYLEEKIKALGLECYTRSGLWMGIFFKDYDANKRIIDKCIEKGVFTDWFLFASNALRVSPPLCIDYQQLDLLVEVLGECLDG
jgi:acetylornithine/N-succinyldiaminopimelate aminotransferase